MSQRTQIWNWALPMSERLRTQSDGSLAYRSTPNAAWVTLTGVASNGQWYNVIDDFGAAGDESQDDGPAIQDAIDYILNDSAHGGVLYFPPGAYEIQTGIVIPRNQYKTLALVGDGPNSSRLHSSGSVLSSDTPVVSFADSLNTPINWFSMRDLYIGRSGDGSAFELVAPGGGFDTERWRSGSIHNCHFRTLANGTKPALKIHEFMNVILRDILCFGGNYGADIKGSQVGIHNLATDQDYQSNHGFKLQLGNATVTALHVQSTAEGGTGVDVTGSTNCQFDGIVFEGKDTDTQILVGAGCYNLEFRHVSLGGSLNTDRIGIDVTATAKNIYFFQLQSLGNFDQANSYGIYIRSGAKYIYGDHCHIRPEDVVAESATGWIGKFVVYTGAGVPSERYVLQNSVGTYTSTTAGAITARDSDNYMKIGLGSPENLDSLSDGYPGQELTLCFTNSNCTVRHATGNIRLEGGVNFTGTENDTLTLLYEGTYWREKSRSVNS